MAKDQKQKIEDALNFLEGQELSMEGYEEITSDTMAIPFIKVSQSLSPEINSKKPECIPGLKIGQFFNNVSNVVYGEELQIVVLKFDRIWIEWKPNRGGFVGYHKEENLNNIVADWTFGSMKTVNGNNLEEYYVYYVLLAGREDEGVMILSLASSNIKVAKELNRMMLTHRLPNGKRTVPYLLIFTLRTVEKSNEKGDWYGVDFQFSGYIDQEQFELITNECKALPGKKVDYQMIENKTDDTSPY